MEQIIWPECLYTFLNIISKSPLEKTVLDCGAGGRRPPLALFKTLGYQTYGIDISEKSLEAANMFEQHHNVSLNIKYGDMRKLPFEDESMSFIYTQNSLCHISKKDHVLVISEIQRVLPKDGFCLVDFMSVESSYCTEEEMGELIGNHEYRMKDGDEDTYHSFFQGNEPDSYFTDLKIIRIDKVIIDHRIVDNPYTDVRYYYFAKK